MRLKDSDMVKLLPVWMRRDPAVKSMAAGMDGNAKRIDAKARLLSRWDKLDQMDDRELDEMAYELNITWYDSMAPIETKRSLIRNSDKVYAGLGTRFAVEDVMKTYFPESVLEEWDEYGGRPYRFRIIVYSEITEEQINYLTDRIRFVKNARSRLESVIVPRNQESTLYVGVGRVPVYIGEPVYGGSRFDGMPASYTIPVPVYIAPVSEVIYRGEDIVVRKE